MGRTAIVVDDHPMCRFVARMALQSVDADMMIYEAATVADALDRVGEADVVTLDLGLPDVQGDHAVARLTQRFPDTRLLVVSGATNSEIERRVAAQGAHGFLSKSCSIVEMQNALRALIDDKTWFSAALETGPTQDSEFDRLASLTPAQMRILRVMASGALNKQIAYDMGLSEITVKAHVKAILKKLKVPNRTHATLMLQRSETLS